VETVDPSRFSTDSAEAIGKNQAAADTNAVIGYCE
jgi:hypothetical protein